jgi:hypothetical protein
MINRITVMNYLNEYVVLELRSPEKSGFLVRSVGGLGPAKADINNTQLSSSDGGIFNSSRLQSRNIVMSLDLLPYPTVEHTRQLSYKYFPIKKRVEIMIETDNRVCITHGYIESNEPDIFSDRENTQISIMCPDPYFYSADTNLTVFSGFDSTFEFPFENLSLDSKVIEMGTIINLTSSSVYYTGDADIGVVFTLNAIGAATNVSIFNSNTGEYFTIDTDRLTLIMDDSNDGIIDGDEITISTVKGNKYVRMLRDGVYTNILNSLDRDADWLQLTRGDNVFAYTAETGITNLQFKIENQIIYEGI